MPREQRSRQAASPQRVDVDRPIWEAPAWPGVETQATATVEVSTSGTVYRCKDYSGGIFWAQAHCSKHNALIDRISSVPAGIPFQQQVEIAEERRRALEPPAPSYAVAGPSPVVTNRLECKALDERVVQLDAMARQPHSAAMQDWIRSERKKARDRQFEIRC